MESKHMEPRREKGRFSESPEVRLGLVGCGVVGTGLLRILDRQKDSIRNRLGGARLSVTAIAVRSLDTPRDELVPRDKLGSDPIAVAQHPDVDIVVELMGGTTLAREVVETALRSGKSVVTANKALLAEHWKSLLTLAQSCGQDLYFEAAVGGGIPVIRVLREALAGDRVQAIRGIVNGTSNYILSRMADEGLEFADVLREAQRAGYAEADPTLDIGGGDACHKLAILASLAFGRTIEPSRIACEGITDVERLDMEFAARFGYTIKPLAVAVRDHEERLDVRVHPALVEEHSVLGATHGALNSVFMRCEHVGPCVLSGPGAGGEPTAVSVAGDLMDVARNHLLGMAGRIPQFPAATEDDGNIRFLEPQHRSAEHYLRFVVRDRPGVLAEIAARLGKDGISIERMVQEGRGDGNDTPVHIVMFTHRAESATLRAALRDIDQSAHVLEATRAFPIERE